MFCRLLFTTFGNDVRIWNLEKFASYGRLSAATHSSRSEVTCLEFLDGANPRVFTGSRDHYVKLYQITPDGTGFFEASNNLATHYDSVTSVVAYGNSLFSSSKDMNIMRFSLEDLKRDHIELQAHSNWIQSMCVLDTYRPLLATACRGGRVKVWDITSTRKLRLVDE
ncbi:unnamed protein product, partial [Gongylonema pulchrum]|uniref:WD_REPEATS_REGION domain-containing protein n=1 Tax=Gongylonema pulchrum TaxID=637853 RepID=A0A183DIY3_9BILA